MCIGRIRRRVSRNFFSATQIHSKGVQLPLDIRLVSNFALRLAMTPLSFLPNDSSDRKKLLSPDLRTKYR